MIRRRWSGPRAGAPVVAVFVVVFLVQSAACEEAARGTAARSSLRGRVGVDAAATLMASQSVGDRIRGLERLGSAGTARAVTRLIRALEPGGSATTADERLTAVRVLAGFTDSADVRRALARVVGGHATPSSTDAPAKLDVLGEETAALALARAGLPDALATLGKALVTPGRAGRAAHVALVAHPPKDLGAVLRAAPLPTLELATTLSELGDPRGEDALRSIVLRGAPDVRAVAALALARLGDAEAAPLARQWQGAKQPAVLRIAAARILVAAHAKDAPAAIAALLGDAETAGDGVALALEAPDPALVLPLSRRLASARPEEAPNVLVAIGRAGSAEGANLLASFLSDPKKSIEAANALARMPGADAARALKRALALPQTRRLAARAGAVRQLVLGEKIDGLPAALGVLAASKDLTDRAIAISAFATLDPRRFGTLMQSSKADVLVSLAPLLFLAKEQMASQVAARITGTSDDDEARTALAFALAVPSAADQVPTAALVAIIDAGGVASPLAARALAARDELRLRPTITDLLSSRAPELRAHTALGLGRSAQPDATGLLESAYRFETNPEVRRAITRALAMRPGLRSRTLALARGLDPDPETREAARGAPFGARPKEPSEGSEVLWIARAKAGGGKPARQTTIATPGGLFLPIVLGPDGQALAAGLPRGSSVLRVAPAHEPDDDSVRDASDHEKSDRNEGGRPGP